MDVYHKVLVKLYEITGGRDSQTVDLKELVKAQGFLGYYDDVFKMLSGQGWIAETQKANFVKITHWGVKEAKNSALGAATKAAGADGSQELKIAVNRLIAETKEVLTLLEEFADDSSKENLSQVERKIGSLSSGINKLKESL